MKQIIITVALIVAGVSCASAQTQSDSTNISLTIINTDNNDVDIAKDFKSTASPYFNDPKAPRFLLYDQKRKVAFGIGGNVRVRTAYDFAGSPTNSIGFVPYSIPVPANSLTKNDFNIDASKSTLFFKLLGNDSKIGQYQAYVSGNFTGNDYNFTLNDAYVSLLGFTVGRTWSTFNDLAAVPPTIDFQGPNGAAMLRTTQIRYTHNLTNNLSFAVAAEVPQTTGTYTDLETAETSQRVPDIPVYLQYNWGKEGSSHVRLAGVMRNMNYRDLIKNKTETETGLGIQLSSNININPVVELYGQITYGNGIAQYINDLSGNGLSIVKDPNKAGRMDGLEALGWFSQVQFNLSKSVFTTVGYSQARIYPKDGAVADTQYKYGQYIVGNVFYNITNNLQLGVEYLWGNRVNMNGEQNSANCVQTLIQFNF